MKKLFLALTLCMFPLLQYAGGIDIEIEKSETPYKWGGKNGNVFEYIVAETDEEYIALRASVVFFSYELKIARYNKSTLDLISVKPLFPKDYIKKGSFNPTQMWGIQKYKDQIYALFGYKDQGKDNITVYHQKLDHEGNMDGDADKLMEAEFLKGKAGHFSGTFSYDSSKFLLVYDVPNKNKDNESYSFHVYDVLTREVVFEREIELPFQDKDVSLERYDVDNEGNVYALVKIFEKKEKGSKGKLNYIYKILGFQKESDEVIEFDFEHSGSGKIFINNITFVVKNGIIYSSGFFGKKNPYDISGVFSLRLDATTGEELVSDFFDFSDEFIEEFYTEKQVDKADKKGKELEIPQIVLDHFIVQDDGSAYMVGEQFYTYTVCYTTSNGTRCVTYYVHNDIIVSKIDETGNILWSVKIPKKSVMQNSSGHLGYHLHKQNDELYFIYYDNAKNFSESAKKISRVPYFTKDLDLVCTKVGVDGEMEKERIYNYGDAAYNQLKLTPIKFQELTANTFMASGFVKGKKEILTRFVVK